MTDLVKAQVLDHGYLALVESWGSDERIVEAARMSTGKGFLGWGPKCPECGAVDSSINHEVILVHYAGCSKPKLGPGDEKLLRYLWENKHATPFEMAGMTVEVQAPIFVFREWHRHRTQSYNEMSSRYEPLPDVNYVPSVERLLMGGGHLTKQAGTVKGAGALDADEADRFRTNLEIVYKLAEKVYQAGLLAGVPKELARVHLPVGRYSRMRASAKLRNWFEFLTLRMDAKAQWEIRQYANEVGKLIAKAFPRTWELFAEKR
jgi:thymidylate synthase (FAD)